MSSNRPDAENQPNEGDSQPPLPRAALNQKAPSCTQESLPDQNRKTFLRLNRLFGFLKQRSPRPRALPAGAFDNPKAKPPLTKRGRCSPSSPGPMRTDRQIQVQRGGNLQTFLV